MHPRHKGEGMLRKKGIFKYCILITELRIDF